MSGTAEVHRGSVASQEEVRELLRSHPQVQLDLLIDALVEAGVRIQPQTGFLEFDSGSVSPVGLPTRLTTAARHAE